MNLFKESAIGLFIYFVLLYVCNALINHFTISAIIATFITVLYTIGVFIDEIEN